MRATNRKAPFNMEDQGQGNGPGAPPEKKRTAEQLAAIHAAMMEELGVSRMDTLPLADKGHHGHVPLTKLSERKPPANAAVARWHNIEFDDVDEANEKLDSIADGQLYRLRRDASSGPSHAPSGRGGHSSSNNFRRGRGGSTARASPSKGSRGGRASGLRGGRNTSGDVGPYAASSPSTPATFFNDARHGASNHARIEKTIAMLKAKPRSAPLSNLSHPPQALSRPTPYSLNLASPEAFMTAVGLKARPENLPGSSSTPVVPKAAFSPIKVVQKTLPSNAVHAKSSPTTSMPLLDANLLTQAPKPSPSQPASSIVGGTSYIARTPTPVFVNRSTGLASSRWATTNPVLPSFSNSSMSTTNASVASTSAQSVSTPVPVVANLAEATALPASILRASTQFINSNVAPMPLQATSSVVSVATQIDDSPAPPSGSLSAGVPFNGSGTLNHFGVPKTGPSFLDERRILIERNVKANKNGGVDRLVKARIRQEIECLNFELEAGGLVLLQTPVSGKVFRFTTLTNMTFSVDPDTYNISFRLSLEASAFQKLLLGHLGAVAILDAPTASTESILNLSGDTNSSSALRLNASLEVTHPTTLHALTAPVLKEGAGISSVPTKSSVAVAQPALHLSDCADSSLLIDFSDDVHESPLPQAESALDDLASLNYDPFVIGLLNLLNKNSGGNFWNHNKGLSGKAILAKVEDQVEAYFAQRSSMFTKYMPDDVKFDFIKETSRNVLEAARAEALESKVTKPEHILQTGYPPSPIVKTPQPQNLNNHEKKCKYSVKELLTLRVVASTVKEELITRAGELEIDGKLPQASRASSNLVVSPRVKIASTSARKPDHQVLKSQGASDMKPVLSKASAGGHAASNASLYANLLSSIGEKKPDQSPSKSTHGVAASKDLTRLTGAFAGLKIGAESQIPTATVSTHAAQAVMAEFPVRSHPNLPAKAIVEVTNSKEEMAKAHVPGLSSSIWSQPSSPSPFFRTGLQPLQQPQYGPVYKTVLVPDIDFPGRMKSVTGLEVIETIPVVAHQMVQPRQENLGFGFQMRPNAFSDFNSDASHYATSPSVSSRPPLSPRKTNTQANIQERLHRSLAERRI